MTDEPVQQEQDEQEEDLDIQEDEDDGCISAEELSAANEDLLIPPYGSDDWNDFLLRQFEDDELYDGNPTCDGCRRLVEQLIGPVGDRGVSEYTPAMAENRWSSTVMYVVNVLVMNDSHPQYGNRISITEIADAGPHNTDAPYCNHPAATAATMAESRCYRKLLGLKSITAEENTERAQEFDRWEPDEVIEDSQIKTLDLMCKRLDIEVMSFINSGRSTYKSIDVVPRGTAAKMLRELNKVQRGVKEKAKSLPKYNPAWRDN
jgi:hypothetical protein